MSKILPPSGLEPRTSLSEALQGHQLMHWAPSPDGILLKVPSDSVYYGGPIECIFNITIPCSCLMLGNCNGSVSRPPAPRSPYLRIRRSAKRDRPSGREERTGPKGKYTTGQLRTATENSHGQCSQVCVCLFDSVGWHRGSCGLFIAFLSY